MDQVKQAVVSVLTRVWQPFSTSSLLVTGDTYINLSMCEMYLRELVTRGCVLVGYMLRVPKLYSHYCWLV